MLDRAHAGAPSPGDVRRRRERLDAVLRRVIWLWQGDREIDRRLSAARSSPDAEPCTAAKSARSFASSFWPGARSVPLALSTANGRVCAIACATFSAREAAAEDQRDLRAARADQRPVERLPRAAPQPLLLRSLRARVEQVEVDVVALEVAHVAGARHLRGLDHARAGPARHLAAERRALVAVQLHERQPEILARPHDIAPAGRSRTPRTARPCAAAPP